MPDVLRDTPVTATRRLGAPLAPFDDITEQLVRQRVDAAARDAYERGRADGKSQASEQMQHALDTVVQAIDQWTNEVRAQRAAALTRHLEIVEQLAADVLSRAPADDEMIVAQRVRAAITNLPVDQLVVKVAPDVHTSVTDLLDDVAHLQVVADPAVPAGGAVVEGGACGAELTREHLFTLALDALDATFDDMDAAHATNDGDANRSQR